MNKHLLPTIAGIILLTTSSIAQVPNGGFETWSSGPGYDDPDQWVTFNSVTWALGGVLSCEEGNPGAVGASFAKITTQNVPGAGVVPGWIFTGDQISGITGFPYTSRPGALNGQWQYDVQTGDNGFVAVSLSKWNTGTQSRDPVGGGTAVFSAGTLTSWQDFSAAIFYYIPDDPDTATVMIYSSAGGGVAGSTVWIDDLQFGAATGIEAQGSVNGFELQPSPATDIVHITSGEHLSEVIVMDTRGREVSRTTLDGVTTTVDVAGLQAGMYIARVRFTDGQWAERPFVKN